MARRRYSQKTNKQIWFFAFCFSRQKTKFIQSFFRRVYGAPICFRFYLIFSCFSKWLTISCPTSPNHFKSQTLHKKCSSQDIIRRIRKIRYIIYVASFVLQLILLWIRFLCNFLFFMLKFRFSNHKDLLTFCDFFSRYVTCGIKNVGMEIVENLKRKCWQFHTHLYARHWIIRIWS